MTKVEINGKTYCVETLIYTIERLTKEVKASAEYHKLVLDNIQAEIDRQQKWLLHAGYTAYNADIALDAIKSVVGKER